MTIEYRTGDLFAQSDLPAIAHGVNTRGLMGAGIARQFKLRYPHMYVQYKLACDLGTLVPGGVLPWEPWTRDEDPFVVFNIASQDEPGAHAKRLWLTTGLNTALDMAETLHIEAVGVPRIAAGIGGLTWDTVKAIFEHVASNHMTNLVVVTPEA